MVRADNYRWDSLVAELPKTFVQKVAVDDDVIGIERLKASSAGRGCAFAANFYTASDL